LRVTVVDQVWATDFTYIPLQLRFLCLVAIMDLYSMHVLSWKLYNSLDTEFCLQAREMICESGPRSEIFLYDHRFQFTFGDFVVRLKPEG